MSPVDVERSSHHYDIPAGIIRKLEALDFEVQGRVSRYICTTYLELVKYARAKEAFDAVMREP